MEQEILLVLEEIHISILLGNVALGFILVGIGFINWKLTELS